MEACKLNLFLNFVTHVLIRLFQSTSSAKLMLIGWLANASRLVHPHCEQNHSPLGEMVWDPITSRVYIIRSGYKRLLYYFIVLLSLSAFHRYHLDHHPSPAYQAELMHALFL